MCITHVTAIEHTVLFDTKARSWTECLSVVRQNDLEIIVCYTAKPAFSSQSRVEVNLAFEGR